MRSPSTAATSSPDHRFDATPASHPRATGVVDESRTYVITGTSGVLAGALRQRLEVQGHRVIGVDIDDSAEAVTDLSSAYGRNQTLRDIEALTDGRVDAVVADAIRPDHAIVPRSRVVELFVQVSQATDRGIELVDQELLDLRGIVPGASLEAARVADLAPARRRAHDQPGAVVLDRDARFDDAIAHGHCGVVELDELRDRRTAIAGAEVAAGTDP